MTVERGPEQPSQSIFPITHNVAFGKVSEITDKIETFNQALQEEEKIFTDYDSEMVGLMALFGTKFSESLIDFTRGLAISRIILRDQARLRSCPLPKLLPSYGPALIKDIAEMIQPDETVGQFKMRLAQKLFDEEPELAKVIKMVGLFNPNKPDFYAGAALAIIAIKSIEKMEVDKAHWEKKMSEDY